MNKIDKIKEEFLNDYIDSLNNMYNNSGHAMTDDEFNNYIIKIIDENNKIINEKLKEQYNFWCNYSQMSEPWQDDIKEEKDLMLEKLLNLIDKK